MIITWLKGKMRIKGPKYTQEISGFRCSNCNAFETSPRRVCPVCKGDYKGRIIPGRGGLKIIPREEEDEQT